MQTTERTPRPVTEGFGAASRPAGPSILLLVTGTVTAIVGGLAVTAAIALIVIFGRTGTLSSGIHRVTTNDVAVVSNLADIQDPRSLGTKTGWPTLEVSATGTRANSVFVGIARDEDVDRYLSGVAVDRVEDMTLSPYRLTLEHHPGVRRVGPPALQPFWVAAGSSHSTADLRWKIQTGQYRIVVMNADGTPGLTTRSSIAVKLPKAFPVSLGVLSGGLLLSLSGILMLVSAILRRRRRSGAPALGA
jgi:hypothetical protein